MLNFLEFLLGTFIVLGHNVFRILPNEVPILAVLGLLSFRLRDGGWTEMGFKRPDSWYWILSIAFIAAGLRIVLGELVIDPLTAHYWPPANAPEGIDEITGNPGKALTWLSIVWTFAAFGEETAYRGYLLNRAAGIFGNKTVLSYWVAVLLVSVLFGFGHFYKGPSGIIDSGAAGLILGSAYILSGRNLWACILAHGLIDTVAVVRLYFGVG